MLLYDFYSSKFRNLSLFSHADRTRLYNSHIKHIKLIILLNKKIISNLQTNSYKIKQKNLIIINI